MNCDWTTKFFKHPLPIKPSLCSILHQYFEIVPNIGLYKILHYNIKTICLSGHSIVDKSICLEK